MARFDNRCKACTHPLRLKIEEMLRARNTYGQICKAVNADRPQVNLREWTLTAHTRHMDWTTAPIEEIPNPGLLVSDTEIEQAGDPDIVAIIDHYLTKLVLLSKKRPLTGAEEITLQKYIEFKLRAETNQLAKAKAQSPMSDPDIERQADEILRRLEHDAESEQRGSQGTAPKAE